MLFGNALDPRGRADHTEPASARPHQNQMGTVLAKDKPVRRSRHNKTLITGHTNSNSLKEIGRYLGIDWAWLEASGSAAPLMRRTWELGGNERFKQDLIAYN